MYRSLISLMPKASLDPDAQAFLTASGITDATITSAINTLVLDLKGYGIWSKMKAIYPFVGGTASSHSYNLVNTAQYQITWNGGITHSSNGVLFNGANGYGNTGLTPSSVMSANSASFGYYSRTASTSSTNNYVLAANNATGFWALILRNSLKIIRISNVSTAFEDASNTTALATDGFYFGTQDASNIKLFRNGSNIGQNSGTFAGNIVNIPLFIGATNDNTLPAFYTSSQSAFAFVGDYLTDTEAANLYTAVQNMQTTLNRNV
jgi:hypothetical protein